MRYGRWPDEDATAELVAKERPGRLSGHRQEEETKASCP